MKVQDSKIAETPPDVSTEQSEEREKWSSGIDFLLSCVGFAVGLGNVWRFPYLCYKNGGGAFLIPYFICLLIGGIPVFFLEISLGQLMSQGGLGVWKIAPAFQGIGIASTVIVFLLNVYYIIILAWDGVYLAMSFQDPLPWAHCSNSWNTDRCFDSFVLADINCSSTDVEAHAELCTRMNSTIDPAVEFWNFKILEISEGVDDVGGLVMPLVYSLGIIWILVYFCVWRGVQWTGKVVYFTSTFPYVVLTILLVRGVTLDGAADGLEFYLKPDFSRLSDSQVWIDGGTQIFFSYALALGSMTALGSYNKFHHNCYRDCLIIAGINSFTSIYAGIVVFSVLGFMAHEQGLSVEDVADKGPGLAFIAYPKAVSQMPLPQLWAVLFFVMIILIGLDSQFVGVEGFVTVICDAFPSVRRRGRREVFIAFYCLVSFLVGLTMVTNGGIYVFELFNYYAASGLSLLWVCFFQCIVVGWIYGAERFYGNIELMIGFRINPWFKFCWKFLTPLLTAGWFIFMWATFEPLTYDKLEGVYTYPQHAQGLGLCMAFVSIICIPGFFIIKMAVTEGTLQERWQKLTTPIFPAQLQATLGDEHKHTLRDVEHNDQTWSGNNPGENNNGWVNGAFQSESHSSGIRSKNSSTAASGYAMDANTML